MKTPDEIIAAVDSAHPNRNRPLAPYIEAALDEGWNAAIEAALDRFSSEMILNVEGDRSAVTHNLAITRAMRAARSLKRPVKP